MRLGEQHSYAWTATAVYSAWEELWARFCEEARELDRRVRREMKDENPTFARLKFFALSPGPDGQPWLQLPGTFRLDDDAQYFCTDMLPRMQRQLSRACWSGAQKRGGVVPSKVGQRAQTRMPRLDPSPTVELSPQLLGRDLRQIAIELLGANRRQSVQEVGPPQKHRPSCWGLLSTHGKQHGPWTTDPRMRKASTCAGTTCATEDAPREEHARTHTKVCLSGAVSTTAFNCAADVEREFTRIRAEQAAKASAAKQEGIDTARATAKAKAHSGAGNRDASRAGEQVDHIVDDLRDLHPTDQEGVLGELLKDAGKDWWVDTDAQSATLVRPSEPFRDTSRAEAMREIDADEGRLGAYPDGLLGIYLRNRLLRLREDTGSPAQPEDVTRLLEEAADRGLAAAQLLEERGLTRKAGELPAVQLSPNSWDAAVGALSWVGHGQWAMFDYRDQLWLDPARRWVSRTPPPNLSSAFCYTLRLPTLASPEDHCPTRLPFKRRPFHGDSGGQSRRACPLISGRGRRSGFSP